MPHWFVEGLATHVSNGAGIEGTQKAGAVVAMAEGKCIEPKVAHSRWRPLDRIPADMRLHMFYRQGSMFVGYLDASNPPPFKRLFEELGQGRAFDDAIVGAYGVPLARLWDKFLVQTRTEFNARSVAQLGPLCAQVPARRRCNRRRGGLHPMQRPANCRPWVGMREVEDRLHRGELRVARARQPAHVARRQGAANEEGMKREKGRQSLAAPYLIRQAFNYCRPASCSPSTMAGAASAAGATTGAALSAMTGAGAAIDGLVKVGTGVPLATIFRRLYSARTLEP